MPDILQEIASSFIINLEKSVFRHENYGTLTIVKSKLTKSLFKVKNFVELFLIYI